MISVSDTLRIISEEAKIIGKEKLDILSCNGLVLAEDILSKDYLPPFDKSAMDGYALRSCDTLGISDENPKGFKVKGVIKAGQWCTESIKEGEAYKIMTGAPIPLQADCVIEVEKVTTEGDKVYLYNEVKEENHVIKFGEELHPGNLVLHKGSEIRPAEIGLFASLGYKEVEVYKRPVVGLIITGDELVAIEDSIGQGKIRNSNEYAITSMLTTMGIKVLSFGIVKDDKAVLTKVIKEALEKTDVVITSGGASAGDYDFVEDILKEIDADIKFNSVAIKPGKPISFATYKDKLFFSLPGNPLSAITTFEQFIEPACKKIMGKEQYMKEEFPVILAEDFKVRKGRVKLIYVRLVKENNNYYAYKIGSQSSNKLTTISKANGVLIVPEDYTYMKAGEVLQGRFIFK
ncbi:gephyrin-like molybdotransferase Glp [Clostridium manihotivorum]|uniref:Molybdopterin molybdenumtransferase n=1 Tax=Clostridium manihotivorum TaxID=2320868 RepID=A0A3R5UGQ8_9CLOT|nr:gephyrin-like molybdotransferase Glp [Clostridium manihotivorum]QAA33326.1 molybdopterin molybdenumtransferase MoeA [Clostridium manihotivorum]